MALVGGHVDFPAMGYRIAVGSPTSGNLRAQATFEEDRLPGLKGVPTLKERIIAPGSFDFSTKGRLFRTKKQLRDLVKKGEVIATISELFGDVVEEIRAPHDGIIVSQRTFGTIHAGEWTVFVGTYAVEPA